MVCIHHHDDETKISLEPTFTLLDICVCLEIVPMETTGERCGFLIVWIFKIFGPLAVKF